MTFLFFSFNVCVIGSYASFMQRSLWQTKVKLPKTSLQDNNHTRKKARVVILACDICGQPDWYLYQILLNCFKGQTKMCLKMDGWTKMPGSLLYTPSYLVTRQKADGTVEHCGAVVKDWTWTTSTMWCVFVQDTLSKLLSTGFYPRTKRATWKISTSLLNVFHLSPSINKVDYLIIIIKSLQKNPLKSGFHVTWLILVNYHVSIGSH